PANPPCTNRCGTGSVRSSSTSTNGAPKNSSVTAYEPVSMSTPVSIDPIAPPPGRRATPYGGRAGSVNAVDRALGRSGRAGGEPRVVGRLPLAAAGGALGRGLPRHALGDVSRHVVAADDARRADQVGRLRAGPRPLPAPQRWAERGAWPRARPRPVPAQREPRVRRGAGAEPGGEPGAARADRVGERAGGVARCLVTVGAGLPVRGVVDHHPRVGVR